MWAFEKFPAKLILPPKYPDSPSYEIEVFGYILDGTMIVFRNNCTWIYKDVGEIRILPVKEFEYYYSEYMLESST